MNRITRNIPEPGPDKQCSKCDLVKPRSEYYVKYPEAGVLFTWCKACHKKKQTKSNPLIVRGESRTCRRCDETKADIEFRPDQWTCHACEKKRDLATAAKAQIQYRQKHRTKLAEKSRERYRSNPIAGAEYSRNLRAKNPILYNSITKKWRIAHPENAISNVHRRRARIKSNGGSWTPNEWIAMKEFYDHTCLWCRKSEPEIKLSPDHIVPLSKGGLNIIQNIQPLCCSSGNRRTYSCNYKKHTKVFDLRPFWPGTNPNYVVLADGSLFYLSNY